jgi:hypothetical protein
VNKMVFERGLSQAREPCRRGVPSQESISHTYQIIPASGIATVSSDRVTKAPYRVDLSEPLPLSMRAVGASEENKVDDVTEWNIERVMSHGNLDDGTQVVKIRWHGSTEAEDI